VAVLLVEAAGQLFRFFRGGLDYAFILSPGCGACYPTEFRLDPSGRSRNLLSGSMSLYRASLRLALFLPLGVSMPPRGGARVRRCEPRLRSALTGRGDRTDRTRVRKSYTAGYYMLSQVIWISPRARRPAG